MDGGRERATDGGKGQRRASGAPPHDGARALARPQPRLKISGALGLPDVPGDVPDPHYGLDCLPLRHFHPDLCS